VRRLSRSLGSPFDEPRTDIYCYLCNDARVDPHLSKHLANFGIEVSEQKKTEKSMTELVRSGWPH
jgi:ubiquitin carboxyl-terminal hydrolase 5/13